jgi:hypothetical protein
MSHLDRLRGEVAALHGLPTQAVSFIQGDSLAEMEASATALAKLVGPPEQVPDGRDLVQIDPVAGLLSAGSSVKAQSARLLQAMHGRPVQPRDTQGRFRHRLDGGARRTPPPRPETHAQTLGRLLRSGSADRGAFF